MTATMWQASLMRKSDALLRAGLDEPQSNRLMMLLSAMGVEGRLERDASGHLALYVRSDDLPAAARWLAEDDSERTAEREASGSQGNRGLRSDAIDMPAGWFGRGRAAVFAVGALCTAVFAASTQAPDAGTRSQLLRFGAIGYSQIRAGELWRLASAVFLHFDVAHLLSNMAALIVIAPPLAHQIGGLRFLVVFVAGGVGANVASQLLAPTAGLKAGASGAIAATLGALGGLQLRPNSHARFKRWQILGALAAFYGLTVGFGPGRDNVAHVAGVLIGIVLGRLIEPPPVHRDLVRDTQGPSRSD